VGGNSGGGSARVSLITSRATARRFWPSSSAFLKSVAVKTTGVEVSATAASVEPWIIAVRLFRRACHPGDPFFWVISTSRSAVGDAGSQGEVKVLDLIGSVGKGIFRQKLAGESQWIRIVIIAVSLVHRIDC
jgi:hypothetical protein